MVDVLDIKRRECYEENLVNGNFQTDDSFCKLVFDGIMCWTATESGVLAKQPCPSYLINSTKYATRKCEHNGKWYVDKDLNRSWTNYSQCEKIVDDETVMSNVHYIKNSTVYNEWFPFIKYVSQSGYVVSLIALITATVIFIGIKKLQCARNKLHMHLFVSFIMRAFMSLLKDFLFVDGVAMKSDLVYIDGERYVKEPCSWICKAITTTRNYFIMANYTLILMEGVYLHNLMFLTLCTYQSKVTVYYIIGWGLPMIFIASWVFARIYYEDIICWTISQNKNVLMILEGPTALSILINFILFVMIVRILLIKLNSIYIQHQRTKYRRLVRSTLILIPLFGVPYVISLIMLFTPAKNITIEIVWIFLDQTFTAFQGLFVAMVYCLLNSEVHVEIIHKYNSLRERRVHIKRSRERTISHTLQYPTTILHINNDIALNNLQETNDYK